MSSGLVGQSHGEVSGQDAGSTAQVHEQEEPPQAAPRQSHGLKQYSSAKPDPTPQGTEPAVEVGVDPPPPVTVPVSPTSGPEEQAEARAAPTSIVAMATQRAKRSKWIMPHAASTRRAGWSRELGGSARRRCGM